jgi:fatty-acyl-CoA synthase
VSATEIDSSRVKIDLTQAARWNTLTVPYLVERGGLEEDRPAVVFEDEQRTYGELRDRARRVANGLVGLGIEPMDRVAVLCSNRLEYIEIECGIAAARAIMVPLNWRLRENELAKLLQRAEARAIIVEDRFLSTIAGLRHAGEVPELRTIIALDNGAGDLNYEELCTSSTSEPPAREGRLEDPHEIIFTSGTTGEPKGVVWSNGGLLFNAIQQVMDFRLGPDCSTYAVIDLYYIGGRHDFTWAVLQAGGTVHVKRSSGFDADAVVRYVAEQGITHVLWVPTMLYEILDLPELDRYDTSKLRMIMCGGQPISAAMTEVAQRAFPFTDFVQVYGLTEGGGSVTFVPPHALRTKPGSAGKPSMHVRIRLVDDEDNDVPVGAEGQILVRAPSVTAGYWDAPELTETSLAGGWLHTGDVGRFDEDGYLYISGRKGDMIISGGMNIFPAEIEDVLRRHESVADVAVIGVPHERWGETVCAVIEPHAGAVIDEQEIIAYCAERLAGYKKPTTVRIVDELPRTVSGKAQKFLLRERFGETTVSAPAVPTGRRGRAG